MSPTAGPKARLNGEEDNGETFALERKSDEQGGERQRPLDIHGTLVGSGMVGDVALVSMLA